MVALGDFNANSNSWYANDTTNIEESKIDILTDSFGFNQIIKEPTHILNNSSSCIDLILTSQPNLVIESGVHSSLHPNYHHQITYVKWDEREVLYYKLENFQCIQRTIANSDWEKAFHDVDVNKQVILFKKLPLILFEISFLTKLLHLMTGTLPG